LCRLNFRLFGDQVISLLDMSRQLAADFPGIKASCLSGNSTKRAGWSQGEDDGK
jgi:hypothetical protein